MTRHALTHILIGFTFLVIAVAFTVEAVTFP